MKGLTEEQLKTVLENTIKRVLEESNIKEDEEVVEEGFQEYYRDGSWHSMKEPSAQEEEPTWYEGERERCEKMGMKFSGATEDCVPKDSILAIYEEEELSETFTSKKDQLLFEKLTKKWTK